MESLKIKLADKMLSLSLWLMTHKQPNLARLLISFCKVHLLDTPIEKRYTVGMFLKDEFTNCYCRLIIFYRTKFLGMPPVHICDWERITKGDKSVYKCRKCGRIIW